MPGIGDRCPAEPTIDAGDQPAAWRRRPCGGTGAPAAPASQSRAGGPRSSGGGPPRPRLCCEPMKIGLTSCDRQLLRPDDARRQQHDDVGLRDVVVVGREQASAGSAAAAARESRAATRRSSSRSRPASRFDSPSRSRSRVCTFREPNDGRFWPAMLMSRAERAVLDEQVEDDVALERHARRHLDVDADGPVVERRQRVEVRAALRDRREHGRRHRNLVAEVRA